MAPSLLDHLRIQPNPVLVSLIMTDLRRHLVAERKPSSNFIYLLDFNWNFFFIIKPCQFCHSFCSWVHVVHIYPLFWLIHIHILLRHVPSNICNLFYEHFISHPTSLPKWSKAVALETAWRISEPKNRSTRRKAGLRLLASASQSVWVPFQMFSSNVCQGPTLKWRWIFFVWLQSRQQLPACSFPDKENITWLVEFGADWGHDWCSIS